MPLHAQQASERLGRITLAPLWEDTGIPLAITGILVVFAALVMITSFITLLPRLMAILDRLHPEKKGPAPAVSSQQDPDELPEEIVVIITAAVAEVMAEPHRVVRVRGLTPQDLGWSMEGRMQHHASHRINRGDRR